MGLERKLKRRQKRREWLRYGRMPRWWKDCESHLDSILRIWKDIRDQELVTRVSFPVLSPSVTKSNRVKDTSCNFPIQGHEECWY